MRVKQESQLIIRAIIALATRVCGSVRKAITVVRPETAIRWHCSLWLLIWLERI